MWGVGGQQGGWGRMLSAVHQCEVRWLQEEHMNIKAGHHSVAFPEKLADKNQRNGSARHLKLHPSEIMASRSLDLAD